MSYAVSAINSAYSKGSEPMSRSNVSRNRYALSRLLYRNAIGRLARSPQLRADIGGA